MRVGVSCSWCHAMNDALAKRCSDCGHNPTRPRVDCDCSTCRLGVDGRLGAVEGEGEEHEPSYGHGV